MNFDTSVPDSGNHRPPGGEVQGIIRHFMILEFNGAGILTRGVRRQYDSARQDLPLLGQVLRDWRNKTTFNAQDRAG